MCNAIDKKYISEIFVEVFLVLLETVYGIGGGVGWGWCWESRMSIFLIGQNAVFRKNLVSSWKFSMLAPNSCKLSGHPKNEMCMWVAWSGYPTPWCPGINSINVEQDKRGF